MRRITSCIRIPLIAHIDTGFGRPLNVRRTVVEVEVQAAGAAAVQIEDEVAPKRCGHFEDKTVVGLAEAVDRVAIAVSARRSQDTVVIARTDPIAVEASTPRSSGRSRSSPPVPTSCSSRPSRMPTSWLAPAREVVGDDAAMAFHADPRPAAPGS